MASLLWKLIRIFHGGEKGAHRHLLFDLGKDPGETTNLAGYEPERLVAMLAKLDELGIAEDTIVMYSTDNGVHFNTWPDAGITPFRSEKNTNWEGGWRVPAFVRWPGKFKAGSVVNGIVSHQDWLATFLAAAGEPDIKAKLLKGYKAGKKTFKVHIDGFNMLPYLKGIKDGSIQPASAKSTDDPSRN